MPYVATCTFREPAKSYFLEPGELEIHVNAAIIGQTVRGVELGHVKFLPREVPEDKIIPPLRSIIRQATPEDLAIDADNRAFEQEALLLAKERIAAHELFMKPIKVEVMHDRAKLFLYYESEERVDFRELLRDLSSQLNMRMQFQQVNSREAAKILGGVGPCGQPLCCATFLTSMPPVTLKMAKEQRLSLTPSKISGACGRLMCCLRYEIDFYRDQNAKLPRPGDPVDTPEGPGHIVDINVFSEESVVQLGDGRQIRVSGETLRDLRDERGPVRACKNHVKNGGSCGGASGGGCSSGGGCGKDGGCGCTSKKLENAELVAV
ncbi:MAG: stage 0 sporulation protein [Abitibacteriaceae bacterium]|nr:stage 0 sporulation protein [Abditibacteriaceae bacterium]MBV9868268.1 stage 0 sporulation protein [Abditibacteriaceae bacterium]